MQTADAFSATSYASFVSRVIAFFIDVVLVAIVAFAVLVGLSLASDALDAEGNGVFVVWFATGFVWETIWIAGPARGKPGQLMVGFRVVRPDGSRVSVGRAAVRWAVRIFTFVTFPFGIIAQFMTLLGSRRNQGVHDVFADTVCVRKSDLEQVGSVQHVPTASQLAAPRVSEPAARPSPIDMSGREDGPNRGPFL